MNVTFLFLSCDNMNIHGGRPMRAGLYLDGFRLYAQYFSGLLGHWTYRRPLQTTTSGLLPPRWQTLGMNVNSIGNHPKPVHARSIRNCSITLEMVENDRTNVTRLNISYKSENRRRVCSTDSDCPRLSHAVDIAGLFCRWIMTVLGFSSRFQSLDTPGPLPVCCRHC